MKQINRRSFGKSFDMGAKLGGPGSYLPESDNGRDENPFVEEIIGPNGVFVGPGKPSLSKLEKTNFGKVLNKLEDSKERGQNLWEGSTLEFQVFNLLSKALYRVVNDGDKVQKKGQPGHAELEVAWRIFLPFEHTYSDLEDAMEDEWDVLFYLADICYIIEQGYCTETNRNTERYLRDA